MSNVESSSLVQRRMLEKHRQWGKKNGINPADIRPQTLKFGIKLDTAKDSYMVDFFDKSATVFAIENRLKDSSLFFANLFGIGLLKAKIFGTPAAEYPAGSPIVFYPDKGIFPTAGSATTLSEAEALEMVYHSSLQLSTDQTIRLDDMSCEIFRAAPDTQNAATTQPSQGLELRDLSTSFFIWGDRKNSVRLTLPAGGDRTNIKGGATSQNYAVLLIGGFEVVNAANNARVKDFAREMESEMNRF